MAAPDAHTIDENKKDASTNTLPVWQIYTYTYYL